MSRVLPILFNTDMVRAILDGRKTVTRRICKDANEYTIPDMSFFNAENRTYAVHNYANKEHTDKLSIAERNCPICPDDILYVRETWSELSYGYEYKADGEIIDHLGNVIKWHPSIHMPKEVARIWLKVKDVHVERLQEITEKQSENEGCIDDVEYCVGATAREHFIELWNSTIKKPDLDRSGWDANPYVWVIEFERCEKPEEIVRKEGAALWKCGLSANSCGTCECKSAGTVCSREDAKHEDRAGSDRSDTVCMG